MPNPARVSSRNVDITYRRHLSLLKKNLPWFVYRAITPLQLYNYKRYLTARLSVTNGHSRRYMSRLLRIERKQLYQWLRNIQKPDVAHLLEFLQHNRSPHSDEMLLPFGRKYGSHLLLPTTWFMPKKVNKFADVSKIVGQLINRHPSSVDLNQFGSLLGYYLSDGAHQQRLRNGRLGTHGFECSVAKSHGNLSLLRYIKNLLEDYGFTARIIESMRTNKPHEFLLYTNRSFFFDYLRYVIIGVPDGTTKTYTTPTNLSWILNSPVDFQEFVLRGIFEGDGEVKGPNGQLGIWAAPMTAFVSQLCSNVGLKSKSYGPKVIFRLNRKSIDRLEELCFLPNIVSDKHGDLLLWKRRLRKLDYPNKRIDGKLETTIVKRYTIAANKKSNLSAYRLAKDYGLAQTTVINVLKRAGRW